jgi:hypothetical protein
MKTTQVTIDSKQQDESCHLSLVHFPSSYPRWLGYISHVHECHHVDGLHRHLIFFQEQQYVLHHYHHI